MKNLSTEELNLLSKYEKQFRTAVYSRYLRAMPVSFYDDFIKIAKEQGVRVNLNCGECMLNAVSTIGRLYFAQKSEIPVPTDSSELTVDNSPCNSPSVPDKPSKPVDNSKTSPKVSRTSPKPQKPKSNKTNKH